MDFKKNKKPADSLVPVAAVWLEFVVRGMTAATCLATCTSMRS